VKSKPQGSGDAPKADGENELLFSRPIMVEQIPEAGTDFVIEASADERAALAVCDGLVAIGKLEARFLVAPRPGRRFNVSGRVWASITQTCVVSLDPFESEITEDIDLDFAPSEDLPKSDTMKAEAVRPRQAKSKSANMMSHDRGNAEEEEDPPDPIVDGKIDLGSIASEFLALGLDPYPRKPGAEFKDVHIGETEDQASPFAILRKLDKTS
jgi:hypothetical protein